MKKSKKYYETNEFMALQKDWYKKLKSEGFQDIETESEKEGKFVREQVLTLDQERIKYFTACEQYLNSGSLTDSEDIFIFEKHCEGLSVREIEKAIEGSVSYRTIHRRIEAILKRAQIEPIDFNN
jgi:hypothetical protein